MEDTQTVDHSPRLVLMRIVRVMAFVFLIGALGERAWWIVPPSVFIGFIIVALVDGRRQLTAKWVLLFGAVAVALAGVLKLTE